MEEFAKTNLHLVEAELQFFAKEKVKEDEEMDHKISNIDGMFKELKMEGYYVPDEEEVKPSNGNDPRQAPPTDHKG